MGYYRTVIGNMFPRWKIENRMLTNKISAEEEVKKRRKTRFLKKFQKIHDVFFFFAEAAEVIILALE